MSALPQQHVPADIDWSQWVSINEAAALMGKSAGHVARMCRELQGRAQAIMAPPEGGGQARWHIHRSADPALANFRGRGDDLVEQAGDYNMLTEAQRRGMFIRKQCLDAFRRERSRRREPVQQWIDDYAAQLSRSHQIRVSRTSLYRWDKQVVTDADVIRLADGRGGDMKSAGDAACWDFFEKHFLRNGKVSRKQAWQQTRQYAHAEGLRWPGYGSCLRQLDTRIPPERQAYHRDRELWQSKYAPKIAQDPERFAAGRCWVGDHTQLDFWVRHGGKPVRPWLTTWQDWRTRKIVGWVLSTSPDSNTILAALRAGLLDPGNMGGPTEVIIDNGRDYDSWIFNGQTKQERRRRITDDVRADEVQFGGIFGLLEIDVHFSIRYCPNGKARQERFYKTMHEEFDITFATYCGGNAAEKPFGINQFLKDKPHQIPTFAHAHARVGTWIDKVYNVRAEHGMADLAEDGILLSPDQAMGRWCTTRIVPKDPAALDLLLRRWEKPVTVTGSGVRIRPLGVPLYYGQFGCPELDALKGTGRKVFVSYDPEDLRQAVCYDERLAFLCRAQQNEFGGARDKIGVDRVKELLRKQRRKQSDLKAGASSFTEVLTPGEQMLVRLGESDEADAEVSRPESLKIRETALDGASKALESHDLRQAAGGETSAPGSSGGDAPPRRRGLSSIAALRKYRPAARSIQDHDDDAGDEGGRPRSPLYLKYRGGRDGE
jgi:transposase InsO family protein